MTSAGLFRTDISNDTIISLTQAGDLSKGLTLPEIDRIIFVPGKGFYAMKKGFEQHKEDLLAPEIALFIGAEYLHAQQWIVVMKRVGSDSNLFTRNN